MPDDSLDADELYVAVRKGVYDAIWDVLGSLAVAVFSFLLVTIGVGFISAAVQNDGPGAILAGVFGLVVALLGVLQFLREFDIWPFDRPQAS